ncbi:MAG: helix-turn-helix domain-containing protein [Solirubrobacterales bacterium]|nr:helix-turn-helix domain-containing protein [Solirubrobacterales bacterium]
MPGELAHCLRTWRDRLSPTDLGLPDNGSRRAPGLRREEVAVHTGISVNYLTRLEQGRAQAPSASVITALARTLRLNPTEAAHLHSLTGHADATTRVAARHITPSIQRILDRFDDVPVIVIDPAWTIVQANPMAKAMLARDLVGENAAQSQFLGPRWVERDPQEADRFEREIAGDLHLQLARHPDDPALTALIAQLQAHSDRFATLWADPPATGASSSRKTFRHPTLGEITVDCDHLEVVSSDLRIVLWSAPSGSPDHNALQLLSVVGAQDFSSATASYDSRGP